MSCNQRLVSGLNIDPALEHSGVSYCTDSVRIVHAGHPCISGPTPYTQRQKNFFENKMSYEKLGDYQSVEQSFSSLLTCDHTITVRSDVSAREPAKLDMSLTRLVLCSDDTGVVRPATP